MTLALNEEIIPEDAADSIKYFGTHVRLGFKWHRQHSSTAKEAREK